ncbi:Alpha/Beta hydrolase protein [Infundibulicybe gibba]|nr:Alpha/Beta hydrolase protein [Infundibulicybe gibba]
MKSWGLPSSLTVLIIISCALSSLGALPSTFPHAYPGQPKGDFSPAWQNYFEVTESLPNITFPLGRSFAGNIPVQRDGHPNNTLFFMGFEKSNGSLTAAANERNSDPWGIWLNGGPGSSSMFGMFFENGPIRIGGDYAASPNNQSWDKLADYFWIDQPVGVGYSTADSTGYVFPSLATRPLHITGESYSGVYITYFGLQNPPVKIAKIAIGDGSIASGQVFELLPAEQSHLCGYDVNLTYPQNGIIPTVKFNPPTARDVPFFKQSRLTLKNFFSTLKLKYQKRNRARILSKRDRAESLSTWKRDLTGRVNGSIDPWYGCLQLDMFIDYAINFTFPWSLSQNGTAFGFDVYNIPDALAPEVTQDAGVFLNDNRTRAALHAPTSKDWSMQFNFVFGNPNGNSEPMVFLTDLATNATAHNVGVVLFSGNDDSLIAHRGTEGTLRRIQGFSRKPSTPWFNDEGKFAGIVHQERNWTYVLLQGAGHLVPLTNPVSVRRVYLVS